MEWHLFSGLAEKFSAKPAPRRSSTFERPSSIADTPGHTKPFSARTLTVARGPKTEFSRRVFGFDARTALVQARPRRAPWRLLPTGQRLLLPNWTNRPSRPPRSRRLRPRDTSRRRRRVLPSRDLPDDARSDLSPARQKAAGRAANAKW